MVRSCWAERSKLAKPFDERLWPRETGATRRVSKSVKTGNLRSIESNVRPERLKGLRFLNEQHSGPQQLQSKLQRIRPPKSMDCEIHNNHIYS